MQQPAKAWRYKSSQTKVFDQIRVGTITLVLAALSLQRWICRTNTCSESLTWLYRDGHKTPRIVVQMYREFTVTCWSTIERVLVWCDPSKSCEMLSQVVWTTSLCFYDINQAVGHTFPNNVSVIHTRRQYCLDRAFSWELPLWTSIRVLWWSSWGVKEQLVLQCGFQLRSQCSDRCGVASAMTGSMVVQFVDSANPWYP
jgi:hypothetical protein